MKYNDCPICGQELEECSTGFICYDNDDISNDDTTNHYHIAINNTKIRSEAFSIGKYRLKRKYKELFIVIKNPFKWECLSSIQWELQLITENKLDKILSLL